MLPSFSLFGYFTIYTLPIFVFFAVFFAAFVFWRLLHQSARYNEFEIFDALIWSTLGGIIAGRLFHIALHPTNFLGNWTTWFNIVDYPGVSILFSLIAASFFFWRYLSHLKIHDLELLDYWVRGVCLALIIYNIGLFFDGSGSGFLTPSGFGLRFPGTDFSVFPTQLVASIFFLLIFFLLGYLEKNYRTYIWYRGTRSQAKTGFVFFTFFLCYAIFYLVSLSFTPSLHRLAGLSLDWMFYLGFILLDIILFWTHTVARPATKKAKRKRK